MTNYPTYKLGEICVIERGGSPRPIKDYLTKDDNGLNWIKIGDATLSNKYIYTTAEKIKPEGLSKTRMVESGDLILSNSMSFGRPYIMRTSGCIHDGWVVFRLNKDIIDEEYLYNILNSNEVYAQFNHLATGSTVKNLNIDRVKEVVIPLPPLPTQHQIVTRIETLFAELDKAVQHLRTAQQQLKTYRQAVLNHWLNNDEGKWEMVPIKEIISVISNGSTPKADKMFSKGEIQFLKVYNLNFDGSINLSKEPVFIERDTHETLLKRSQTKQGDVLINIVGPPLGKVSIVPEGEKEYNINQAIVMFRPNEFVTSKFLAFYLMSPQVIEWLTSTSKATAGQYNVKVSTCREIMFPKVSIQEQQRIVNEIESRLSQATASETYIENALQQAEALRQSILKKAFSGELV